MANEAFSVAAANQFNAGELLDALTMQLKAANALTGGNPNGLIHSLDHSRGAQITDGLGIYSASTDRPRDLDVRATFANNTPMARKNRGTDQPRYLHGIIEQAARYDGATGRQSLTNLARLALGLTAIATESANSPATFTLLGDNKPETVVDDAPFDAPELMSAYDNFTQKRYTGSITGLSLAKALSQLEDGDGASGLQEQSDVCVVASDFRDGAVRNKTGDLISFNWEQPLRYLSETLGDRLFVMQLTTPAQTELPYSTQFNNNGKTRQIDAGQYLRMAESYHRRGVEKSEQIQHALNGIRSVEISTLDPTPLITMADFVFGEPEEL